MTPAKFPLILCFLFQQNFQIWLWQLRYLANKLLNSTARWCSFELHVGQNKQVQVFMQPLLPLLKSNHFNFVYSSFKQSLLEKISLVIVHANLHTSQTLTRALKNIFNKCSHSNYYLHNALQWLTFHKVKLSHGPFQESNYMRLLTECVQDWIDDACLGTPALM